MQVGILLLWSLKMALTPPAKVKLTPMPFGVLIARFCAAPLGITANQDKVKQTVTHTKAKIVAS